MKIVPPAAISVPAELLEQGQEAVETHLSWVLLTERFVYKWKKPVKLPFVDFTKRDNRFAAAAAELELNRRLAPQIYLGLGGIELVAGKPKWSPMSVTNAAHWSFDSDKSGEPVLVMKRIPKEAFIDHQLSAGNVDQALLMELAKVLAGFHRSNRISAANSEQIVETARLNALDNFTTLLSADSISLLGTEMNAPLERTRRWTADEFDRIKSVLFQRLGLPGNGQDCLVDGHGDLRLEHVAVMPIENPRLQIIDCIEFSEDFRRIDQAADIAFLAMDLKFNHRADFAELLTSTYASLAEDPTFDQVVPWFEAYRALVRAKVHALRAAQQVQVKNTDSAREQITLAGRYISLACRNTFSLKRFPLIVVCGMSGTGKSTVAREFGRFFDPIILNTDVIRQEKSSFRPKDDAYGVGRYSVESRLAVYDQLFERAAKYLGQGNPVILDATFQSRSLRERAQELAKSAMVPCLVIECLLDRDQAIERLQRRQQKGDSVSDAGPSVYEEQLKAWEPIQQSESFIHFVLRTDGGARGAIGNSLALLEPLLST